MSDEKEKTTDELEEEKKNADIEIVSGDGKNLDISPVYDHIKIDRDQDKNDNDANKEIIIPKSKK